MKSPLSKYIIIEQNGIEVPVVFSPCLSHEQVAGLKHVKSAGFCTRNGDGKWIAKGRADSLQLTARPEDAYILNNFLFL